ncbi:MAG: hypothetical protein QXX07_00345 [Candidatus Aenigmatarchaeota archaeon]
MVLIEERAENLDFATLNELESALFHFKERLKEYFLSEEKRPLFVLGPKGSGKTFQVMKSLSEVVRENEKLIPTMFIFKEGLGRQILNPLKLAAPEIWKDRLKVYSSDTKDLLDLSNVIVVDDIHYVCEAIAKGEYTPEDFLKFLKEILNFVDSGKKVVLISEDIPSFYTENLKMKEFDDVWPKFGIHPRSFYKTKEEWESFSEKIDYLAFREIPTYTYLEWCSLIEDYGIFLEESFQQVLYRISPKPRSFVRFVKLFQPKTCINLDEIKIKALELLREKVERQTYQFYEFLINYLPVVGFRKADTDFLQILRNLKSVENLRKLGSVIDYVEEVCKSAANNLPLKKVDKKKVDKYGVKYIIKKNYKDNPVHTQTILQKAIQTIVPEEKIGVVNEVIKIYFMTKVSPNDIIWANEVLEKLEEKLGENKKYLSKLARRFSHYYIEDFYWHTGDWLLYKPFEIAFGDMLYETPSIIKVTAEKS